MRFLRMIPVVLMILSLFAVLQAPAAAAPAKPTADSPGSGRLDVSANPTLEGSAYSGSPGHKATRWELDDNSDFSAPEWARTSATPETHVVVNATNGTFANHLAGKTGLDENETYFWRVSYMDTSSAWSGWGSSFFITATTTWYLAEGSTDGGMETWLLVQNPGDVDAHVNVEFQTGGGTVPGPQDEVIPPNSRRTYFVGAYVTTFDVSTKVTATQGTIVCERAVYGPDRVWGHDSIGVTKPAATWYMAEGATTGGFETWVLVQNPNPSPVKVSLSLQTDEGLKTFAGLQNVSIPAASRKTFEIGRYVQTYNVSTKVVSTGGDVICERAVYGNNRQWGHDSIGTSMKTFGWAMAEGCTAGGFETWVLVQNPEGYDQLVFFAFGDENGGGPIMGPYVTVPANSRISVNVGDYIQSYNVAISVQTWNESGIDTTGKIICERAMYDNARTWGHDSIASPLGLNYWTLPEGSTAGGMENWVLVMNFHPTEPVDIQLVFMTDQGIVVGPTDTIPAFARRSYNVGDYVNTFDVSTLIDASTPYVTCERSMYGPERAWATNSIGYILGIGDPSTLFTSASISAAAGSGSLCVDLDPAAYTEAFLRAARDRVK